MNAKQMVLLQAQHRIDERELEEKCWVSVSEHSRKFDHGTRKVTTARLPGKFYPPVPPSKRSVSKALLFSLTVARAPIEN